MNTTIDDAPKWEYAVEQFVYYAEEHPEHSPELSYMLSELSCQRKIFVDYEQAHSYFKRSALTQGLQLSDDVINEAYDIAYGMGCEYEWK